MKKYCCDNCHSEDYIVMMQRVTLKGDPIDPPISIYCNECGVWDAPIDNPAYLKYLETMKIRRRMIPLTSFI